MSGGGGGQPSSQTVYNSSLPEYAKPYVTDMYSRAQTISKEDYQPYSGQRIAGQGGDTSAGLDAMRDYAGSNTVYGGLINDSNYYADMAMGVGDEFDNYSYGDSAYSPTDFNRYTSQYGGSAIGMDGQDVTRDWDSAAAQQYMNPYTGAVIDRAKAGMYEDYLRAQNKQNTDAAGAGAFGGSRAAMQNMLAQRDYLDRSLDYEATSMDAAYQNAQSQFERDRAARMGLAARNQDMGMWEQTSDDAAKQYASQYGLNAEQLRQAGLTGQISALDMAGTMTDRMSQLQQAYDKSEIDRANALLGVGQTEEAYQQDQLDQAYRDFVNQRDYEKNQLAWYNAMIKGVPITNNSDQMTYQPQNNVLGAIGGIGALGQLGGLAGAQ